MLSVDQKGVSLIQKILPQLLSSIRSLLVDIETLKEIELNRLDIRKESD